MIGFIQPGNYILHEHFVAFGLVSTRVSNRNELFRPIARIRFRTALYRTLFSFFPPFSRFRLPVLFKNIPRLKSNEFIFSNWRRKADIGFIISLFPFYSPYIRFDSFRICFRLFFFHFTLREIFKEKIFGKSELDDFG